MKKKPSYNILMYSHDTYGLGHIRRTMAIASHLRGPDVNILILTGSPIAGRFTFPEHVDFVRIPGMIKKTNDEYRPLSIKIDPEHALNIRKSIITSTAKAFRPDLFIVDKEPLGLKKEVLQTLQWIRRSSPKTKTILGLRDVMDEAEVVRKDWKDKGVYQVLDTLYDEIWIYGIQRFYDPIKEYALGDALAEKIQFTGYIPRKIPSKGEIRQIKKEQGVGKDEKLVVVTAGGGGDGFSLMDSYLSMLESAAPPYPLKSVLITGPFMPKAQRKDISKRAKRLGIKTYWFYRWMEKIQAAADLVVSMGGYNTVCEILSQGTISLLIPRETPRKEQLIRAQILSKNHLVDYIPWDRVAPAVLGEKVQALLEHPEPYQDAIDRFQLTGLERMRQRIVAFQQDGS